MIAVRARFGIGRAGRRLLTGIAFAGLIALLAGPMGAADLPPATEARAPLTALDPWQLAERIDQALAASWAKAKLSPAPAATDAEFLRRVYLDLNGRIPPVAVVRQFLADERPDRRRLLIETLLARGAHAAHFANTWRDLLISGSAGSLEARAYVPQFDTWLRLRFAADTPYNEMVQELLTASPAPPSMRSMTSATTQPSPLAFYQAAERKAEQLAANTSRVFLGVQVQCAQCHNDFFSNWKRTDFWALAGFFADIDPNVAGGDNVLTKLLSNGKAGLVRIPDTKKVVELRFLDGSEPQWQSGLSNRAQLARWLTSRTNPWFAKAAVNRLWEHFFGRGLVHPVDRLDPANPPSHPELFDELANQFMLHNFDVKYLVRAITATRAYQLSSRGPAVDNDELQHFTRVPLRRMTGDQLFDSIVQATGFREPPAPANNPFFADVNSIRAEFQAKFSEQSLPRTEAETSILQALAMMNGRFIGDAVSLERSETLLAVADAPLFDTASRVETLFLATLTRIPDADELAGMAKYVDSGGPTKNKRAALANVFWALLNSAEFVLSH